MKKFRQDYNEKGRGGHCAKCMEPLMTFRTGETMFGGSMYVIDRVDPRGSSTCADTGKQHQMSFMPVS